VASRTLLHFEETTRKKWGRSWGRSDARRQSHAATVLDANERRTMRPLSNFTDQSEW